MVEVSQPSNFKPWSTIYNEVCNCDALGLCDDLWSMIYFEKMCDFDSDAAFQFWLELKTVHVCVVGLHARMDDIASCSDDGSSIFDCSWTMPGHARSRAWESPVFALWREQKSWEMMGVVAEYKKIEFVFSPLKTQQPRRRPICFLACS